MTSNESPDNDKKDRLRQVEIFLCIALAIALNISLTAAWVVLIIGFVVAVLRPNLSQRLQKLSCAPLTIPLLVFSLAVTVSTLVAGGTADMKQIFSTLRSFLIYFYIYQAFACNLRPEVGGQSIADGCEQKTLAAFLYTAGLAGLYGTVQQIFNFHPFTYPYLQATGFLQAPMPFAGLMQMSSFLALGIFLKKGYLTLPGKLKDPRFFTAVVAANFMGLFFSCERSAWLGMLAGVLLITLHVSPRTFLKSVLALVVILGLAWCFVPAVKARLAPLTNPQSDVGVSTRLKIWQRSLELYKQHPFVGVGPSHFPRITDIPEALVPGHSTDLNHAHSNYLQMMATLGTLGFLAFMAIVVFSLRAALKQNAVADSDWDSGVGLGVFGALVSLMVSGIFEYNFGSGQVKLAQWFVLGALKADGGKKSEG
ncbi:MAG: O-antigen ligase family protein [Cyanobacteria bacterium SZAS TMP-1]|nr:O-antigen ligase family protein [Cyanobacteria bacterium SZAS TMP-1]